LALVRCPECKKEISNQATACPHCGYPLRDVEPTATPPKNVKRPRGLLWVLISVAVILLILVLSQGRREPRQEIACDSEQLNRVIKESYSAGLVHKIDAARSVPRIYVGGPWYLLDVDAKKGMAYWLVCEAYGGKFPSDALVVFHDSRSGVKVAEWGGLSFRVFK
jgi:zinc-ribbon domain